MNTVLKWAGYSRLILIAGNIFFYQLTGEFDCCSDAMFPRTSSLHSSPSSSTTPLDPILFPLLKPFLRWDALYFLHLSRDGYVYEHDFAFFPLLPLSSRFLGQGLFYATLRLISLDLCQILAGLIISNVSFVAAACLFYQWTMDLFDPDFARLSALLFCLMPSGIFMSAFYTESLFAFWTFLGLFLLNRRCYLSCAMAWFFAGLTRSNAVVYVGFFIWEFLIAPTKSRSFRHLMVNLSKTILYSCIVWSSFFLFQWYAFSLFCTQEERRPWCKNSLPLIYTFVQAEYWNNGFLKYYEWRQTHNFLFAAPMIVLSLTGIWTFYSFHPRRFLTLGFTSSSQEDSKSPFLRKESLPHLYLWLLLTLYALAFMHVQVITRFFSSQAPVFWFAAHLCMNKGFCRKWVISYFCLYNAIGLVLFSNFLPPA